MNRRVVVSGLGVVSPVGIGKVPFWRSLVRGKSGIRKIASFDTSKMKRHYAGEIKDFNPEEFAPKEKIKFMGRATQLAVAAVKLALEDSGLKPKHIEAVFLGTTMAENLQIEYLFESWFSGRKDLERKKVVLSPANNLSGNIGIHFKMKGKNILFPTACSAGNYAVGYGFDLIRRGDIDCALCAGADALSKINFQGFLKLYAMAPRICQPFDKNRKGMLIGEGAGVLVLEELEHALNRGAHIYAEVLGYGLSCDAYHITAPHPRGIRKAIEKALNNSGISVDDVDYISAHGTGTLQNDKAECHAIREVFGRRYRQIPVSSIKSMLGHCMGAASSIEAVSCCLALQEEVVPPTINYKTPDPECDIDCVPNKARKKSLRIVLNNGFAFGGNNCCVVFKRYGER